MRYIVKINNREFDFLNFKVRRQVGMVSQPFTGYCQVAGAVIPQPGDSITVHKEIMGASSKILKFQGTINGVGYMPSEKAQLYILAYDKLRKIMYEESAIKGFASPIKCSANFSSQISPTSKTDLTAGTVDTTDSPPDSVNFGKSITGGDSLLHRNQCIDILQMISNRDAYVTRAGVANFLNGAGTDRSTGAGKMELIDGINGNIVGEIGYFEDDTRRIKKVVVKGKGAGVKDSYFGQALAGDYTTNDKMRQFEFPFLVSAQTCNTVAANLLAEINKRVKYTKFQMRPDPFSVDYDIFDTVKLKARLPNKTVNENLKIFSIETDVSIDKEVSETVTLELLNFGRGIWAQLLMPNKAGEAIENNIALSSISTQAQDHVGASGGSSVVTEEQSTVAGATVGLIETTLDTFAPSSANPIAGFHVFYSFRIFTRQQTQIVQVTSELTIYARDVTAGIDYPPVSVGYHPYRGDESFASASLFIPANAAGHTIQVKASTNDGDIDVLATRTYYTIGEHQH